ncbi:MAG: nuclear transport factor 2 family protein [Candidatus Neomarinimicrobiota bacterium]
MSEDINIEKKAVLAVIEREISAAERSDFAAYESVLGGNCVFMPPNSISKSGNELRGWLKIFLDHFSVQWLEFTHDDISIAGDLAVHSYTYRWQVTSKTNGSENSIAGKGIHILRRMSPGDWKIIREIWNDSPA